MDEQSLQNFQKIIQRRDPRYDGRFFFGVKTTQIYCRPICPAKPKAENIVIFRSATEAEKAGFRPCLRCKPDAAPGSRILDGTSSTVARALRLLDEEENSDLSLEALSFRLGISDRHLRRLFEEHLGASPVEILISKRLHLAKTLLQQTQKTISEIALVSGFKSLRRFNEAFKQLYQVPPSQFRSEKSKTRNQDLLTLTLPLRMPYDAQLVLTYLKRHEAYGIEVAGADYYIRYLPLKKGFAKIRAEFDLKKSELKLQLWDVPLKELRSVLFRLKHLLDLDHHPAHLPEATDLQSKGVRVPASFDAFEVAVSIILSQLVSTEQARAKLKHLIQKFGRKLGEDEGQELYAFPTPQELSHAPVEEIGITRVKAHAIRELARSISEGQVSLSRSADLKTTRDQLLSIKGIGPWTVELIAMRCLGDADAFPSQDLIIKRIIDAKLVDETIWNSSRAYLTHLIWRDYGISASRAGGGKKE